MKLFPIFLSFLIGFTLTVPEALARGDRGDRDGKSSSRASMPKRDSGKSSKRSPMTGSKLQRPEARPQPKPVARPQFKPDSRPDTRPSSRPAERPSFERPSVEKPSVQRPSGRPDFNRPETRPSTRPDFNRPETRPDFKPGGRPEALPPGFTRPGGGKPDPSRPAERPGITRPDGNNRPDKRPSLDRPNMNRPSTLPGMVTYPNRPGIGDRPVTLPGRPGFNNRPGGGNYPNIGNRPGFNNRPGGGNYPNISNRPGYNRPSNRPINTGKWDRDKWGGNHGVWGNNNNVNININNKFKNNYNYSYRPNYWGGRPWWGAGHCHNWHHGHWGYGWNSHYYNRHWYFHDDDDFASGFMWGIAVWSVGNMIYDMGYKTYHNPYPAPAVQNTYINYAQPVSVAAAANPPGGEEVVKIAETKSAEAVERSRAAFRNGDYMTAMTAVDEALGHTPGDVTLHEYRALVFFALGKYADAAGVLNPVLASGPGWGWDTMIGFYNGSGAYNDQLRKLENHVKGRPEAADGHFLLGYHYMVCGHTGQSYEQFAKAAELQPADSISRQLRDLTKSSLPVQEEDNAEPPARPDPVPAGKLTGTWISDRGAEGKVTFTMAADGNYTWNFMNGGQSTDLKGTYELNDKGLLVMSSEDSQMISEIVMKDDKRLQFTLVGAPDGDPGLEFVKN